MARKICGLHLFSSRFSNGFNIIGNNHIGLYEVTSSDSLSGCFNKMIDPSLSWRKANLRNRQAATGSKLISFIRVRIKFCFIVFVRNDRNNNSPTRQRLTFAGSVRIYHIACSNSVQETPCFPIRSSILLGIL